MDTSVSTERKLSSKGRESSAARESNSDLDAALFWRDPAAYLIYLLVNLKVTDRRSDLEAIIGSSPETRETIDAILSVFVDHGLVEIQGDKIRPLKLNSIILQEDPESLRRFLPQVFRIMVSRVLLNEAERPMTRKARKEMVRYASFPDDPEIAAELQQLNNEYKAKIVALQEKALRMEPTVRGIRFTGIVTGVLEPEDFL